MSPRLLSETEFRETFAGRMVDITGNENVAQPEGVIDLGPYLEGIPVSDFAGIRLLSDAAPAAVYRSGDSRFDHVLYPSDRANVYLVVVVALRPDHVHGHYLLDLNAEYGLGGNE